MAAKTTPTVRRRRLGAELRRLRQESGLTSVEVAKRLMVSQPKISHIENGRRAIKPRDVRDLCALYGVTAQQALDSLLRMARESGQRGWWTSTVTIPGASTWGWRRTPPRSTSSSPWRSPVCCKPPPTPRPSSKNRSPGLPSNRPPGASTYGCAASTGSTTRSPRCACGWSWRKRHCVVSSAAPRSCASN